MSKERLEEIEDLFEDISNDMMPPYTGITCDTVVDVKWVIKYAREQAERAQELEEDKKVLGGLIEKTAKISWDIEQQNKHYREYLELIRRKGTYGTSVHNGKVVRSDEANLADEALGES